jgi:hypothetical protein
MMNTLAIWKGPPEDVRLYAKRLSDYFKTELGGLLLENLCMSTIVRSQQMAHQQFLSQRSEGLVAQPICTTPLKGTRKAREGW